MFRVQFFVSNELMRNLKNLKIAYRFSRWNDLFKMLIQAPTPINYQSLYQKFYNGKARFEFDMRLEEDILIKFNLICAYFRSREDCLDYLVEQEKIRKMVRPFII